MTWRRPDQGPDFGFTAKGSHEGTGEGVSHLMAPIAYGKVVIATGQFK